MLFSANYLETGKDNGFACQSVFILHIVLNNDTLLNKYRKKHITQNERLDRDYISPDPIWYSRFYS